MQDRYLASPLFQENELECLQFERIARELRWLEKVWHISVQSKLGGKDGISDRLKAAVLCAYQGTNMAYRQKFRHIRKIESGNYCEFAAKKELSFDRWIGSK